MNQWAKILSGPNFGRVVPISSGPPIELDAVSTYTGETVRKKFYTIPDARKFITLGPRHTEKTALLMATHAELLGPDECARLDALHGLI